MRRFIAFAAAAASALALIAPAAAEEDTVTGYVSENTVYTDHNEADADTAVLSFYDNGKLSYSVMAEYTGSEYTFDVPSEYLDDRARICYMGGGVYDMTIEAAPAESAEPTEAPTETAAPAETAEPESAATPKPVNTPYPSAYDSERDADNAPAVVKSLSVTEIDGEEYDVLTMLYTGSEITVNVRDTVEIVSAPDAASYLIGQGTDALRDGDVIHFTTDLQGRIKSIELIYRPDFTNYVADGSDYGTDFEDLISASGIVANQDGWRVASYGGNTGSGYLYAFGVPIETEQGFMVLANADGTVMDIDVNPSAMVYTIDDNSRSDKSEFSGNGGAAVMRTAVPNSDRDDEGNVISWEDIEDVTYALVRIIDGMATDIFVFVS